MPLDVRGKIAAAQIAFYVPIAVISLLYFIRYLLSRDAGWLMLLIFALSKSPLSDVEHYRMTMSPSSLARIAGGSLIVAAESIDNPSVDLFIAAYLLFHVGLAILMIATIGFLSLACVQSLLINLAHT